MAEQSCFLLHGRTKHVPLAQDSRSGISASETEIKVHYMQLARKYHPDKNDCVATGLTMEEATEFFKLLNNANDYLKERAWVDNAP